MIACTVIFYLAFGFCEALPKPSASEDRDFPHLKTVDHGHGATSYQNVNVQNFLSVPIPKDLQVDDGHEYKIQREYPQHPDDKKHHDISSLDLLNYVDSEAVVEHVIIPAEASEDSDDREARSNHESQYSAAPSSNYENYDHEMIEYEYH
ncbi:uncharacterized protein [Venturia canescens]|uniref:uncharacterized protein n=1 Tax=Venturia canescens TaxID=32260 RepID=UPI001C9C0CC3|nr:uncharacterized protein LOC122417843 [Venturia canescens]